MHLGYRVSTVLVVCYVGALVQLTGCPPPPPDNPTYAANVANWKQGPPEIIDGNLSVDGLQVTVTVQARDPSPLGSISACSYNFGDNTPAVEVTADALGNCEPGVHTYAEAGLYAVVATVWDKEGMLAQQGAGARVGGTPGISERQGTHIGGCLEAYWWTPDSGGPFPTLVQYTPYNVDKPDPPMQDFMASGVAVLLVTNRGQGSSCDPADLFGEIAQQDLLLIDTWLAAQPWATGDYCLFGHSGPGIMGTLSSAVDPPHLRCAVVGGGDTRFWDGLVTKSGAWWPIAPLWTFGTYGEAAELEPETRVPALVDLLVPAHRPTRSPAFFDPRDRTDELRTLNVPILFETSWDDLAWGGGPAGGPYLDLVQDMVHPGSAQVIFPGLHPSFDPSNAFPFTLAAPAGGGAYTQKMRQFIFHYLKGGPVPDTTQFNYLYFQLEGGVQAAMMNRKYGGWQTSDTWPPAGTSPVILYLRAEPSGTVSARFDGSLLAEPPAAPQTVGPFPYQPAPVWDPVYSSGGTPWAFYTFPDMRATDKAGIAFTSPPLAADAVVQGPVRLTLTAQTNLYDHDWMAMLSDVWPDGSSHRLSSGFTRVSLRNGYDVYAPGPSGNQTYTLELASLANVFEKGHHIRVTLHQLNADDSSAAARQSSVQIGAAQGRLVIHADGGAVGFEPYAACADCNPDAEAEETLEPYFDWYVTGAVKGTDPVSGGQAGCAFVGKEHVQGDTGSMALYLEGAEYARLDIVRIDSPGAPGYDYELELSNGYVVQAECGRDGQPGTVLVDAGGQTVGPLQVSDGSVRCFDTPYVNW